MPTRRDTKRIRCSQHVLLFSRLQEARARERSCRPLSEISRLQLSMPAADILNASRDAGPGRNLCSPVCRAKCQDLAMITSLVNRGAPRSRRRPQTRWRGGMSRRHAANPHLLGAWRLGSGTHRVLARVLNLPGFAPRRDRQYAPIASLHPE